MLNCVMSKAWFNRFLCNYFFYLWSKSNFQLRLISYSNDELEQAESDKKEVSSVILGLLSKFQKLRL